MQKINSVASAMGSTTNSFRSSVTSQAASRPVSNHGTNHAATSGVGNSDSSPSLNHGVSHSAGLRSNHSPVSATSHAAPRPSSSISIKPAHRASAHQSSKPVIHSPAHQSSNSSGSPSITPSSNKDELARVFNTVLVSTQSKGKRDFSGELSELSESAPFKAILSAVRQLSRIHGMTERQASEQIIQTFRKMDQIWGEYVFREGLEKLKSSK